MIPDTARPASTRMTVMKRMAAFTLVSAAVINFFMLAWHIAFYTLEAPFEDELCSLWSIETILSKHPVNYFGWGGAHKCPVPRFIQWNMAALTHWNLNYETALNLAMAVIVFLSFSVLARRAGGFKGFLNTTLLTALSFCIFSSRGYLDWIWGEQMGRFINVAGAAAGMAFLSGPRFKWRDLAAGAFCGLLSNYSGSAGLAFWPAGLLLVAPKDYKSRFEKASGIGTWLAIAAVSSVFYLKGYTPTEKISHQWDYHYYFFENPKLFIDFSIAFLGNAVLPFSEGYGNPFAWWAGLISIQMMAASWLYLMIEKPHLRRAALAFSAPALYAAINDIAATLNRATIGVWLAANPQYSCVCVFFTVSLFLLGALCIRELAGNPKKIFFAAAVTLYSALLVFVASSSFLSFGILRDYSERTRRQQKEIFLEKDPSRIPQSMRYFLDVLKRRRLSVFRDEQVLRRYFRLSPGEEITA